MSAPTDAGRPSEAEVAMARAIFSLPDDEPVSRPSILAARRAIAHAAARPAQDIHEARCQVAAAYAEAGVERRRAEAAETALAEARAVLAWYADSENWTSNRTPGAPTVSIETRSLFIGDLRRPPVGLTVAILDMGRRARAILTTEPGETA